MSKNGINTLIMILGALVCLLSAVGGGTLLAQDTGAATPRVLHDLWTTEDGLPQNSVTAIVQTQDGYLWLGTFGGLARFDGIKFHVFDVGNTEGMRSSRVLCLYEDRDGALWIGTEGGGLTQFKQGIFTTYTTKDGLPDDYVHGLGEDGQGNLWVGTMNGLARFDHGGFTVYTTRDGLPSNHVFSVCEGRDGGMWFSSDRGLIRYQRGTFTTTATCDGIPLGKSFGLQGGPDGSLWLATYGGLFRYHAGALTTLATNPAWSRQDQPSDVVVSIYENREGNVRFLMPRGVARFKDGTITVSKPIAGLSSIMQGVLVRSAIEDMEGNLWIGTDGKGLHRFKVARVTAYSEEEGLSDGSFMPITEDSDGGVWLGSVSGGLYRFHAGTFTTHNLYASDLQKRRGLIGPWALRQARDGGLWIGDYFGLHRFQGGRLVSFDRFTDIPVMSIYEGPGGTLWIGTLRGNAPGNPGGLYRLKDGGVTAYRMTEGLVDNDVRFITEDRQGALWIGTMGGLSRFKDGHFTNYTTENGLSHDNVRDIYEDADGALWIGTYGGGLNRFKDGTFTHITTKDGLADNIVSRILVDDDGNFWMSCNRGIYQVRREELNDFADGRIDSITCISYGVGDGMKTSECNGGSQPAGWKMPDGKLWFPTIKGVVVVDPNKINQRSPPVHIEQVLIDKRPIDARQRVDLPPGQGDLEIHYTGLCYTAPEKVRFKYKLEGYDDTWEVVGTRRVAYYTKIPPGRYTFNVLACNNDGVWNEAGAAFAFYLAPHFYQTNMFYALCTLALMLLGWSGYELRVNQLKRRTQALEARVTDRTTEVVAQKNQLTETNQQLQRVNLQLARTNDDMLSIFNQLSSGVMTIDDAGRVLFLSRAAEPLVDHPRTEVLGRRWDQVLPLKEADKVELRAMVERPAGQRTKLLVHLLTGGGRRYWMEIKVQDDPRDAQRKIFFLYDVSEVYDLRRLLDEKAKFRDLIGQSKAMMLVYRQIEDLARVDTTVLVEGETGTGKELVARAIHYASERKNRPFIAVNCAGLTESLLASQLFGHKRGAFTGAVADQVGLLEAANGGTLFLDEMGDIPMHVQTSLLRVLQEREITRLGEARPRKIDARVIAATHHDLSRDMAAGKFRQDLLYRIRVARIQIPPLRERQEDIPLLVAWFLGHFRTITGKSVEDVSEEAMQALTTFTWPGNVRELKSAIETAVIRCEGAVIQTENLPREIAGSARPDPPSVPTTLTEPETQMTGVSTSQSRAAHEHHAEREELLNALKRTGGNRAAAARLLGISRKTLYRRLLSFSIEPEELPNF